MELSLLKAAYTVCKLPAWPTALPAGEVVFLARTRDEISLVCETARLPAGPLAAEHGWRAVKVEGVLDFGMVGVIAAISGILAGAGISLFVVSTYNTDYILIKQENCQKAMALLAGHGYHIL